MPPNTKFAPPSAEPTERFLFEKDLPVKAAGLRELLARLRAHVPEPGQLLVLMEATGVLHLNWAAALSQAGYPVVVINPLIARRLYSRGKFHPRQQERSDRCARALWHRPHPGREAPGAVPLQNQTRAVLLCSGCKVRAKRCAKSLSNLKKSYRSLLDVSFPELGQLLEIDGVGIRQLLEKAPTPAAIARIRRSTLEKNWMLRPKAAALKKLAADFHGRSRTDCGECAGLTGHAPELSPRWKARLRGTGSPDRNPGCLKAWILKSKALLETIPGFGPISAAKVLAFLPSEVFHAGSNRKAAARLQAFMGNDPRLRQSGQWKGQTKMSKRGVETLRTALFQGAFNASRHDPELRAFYLRKRGEGKHHEVALSHLMRILTRRLVAVFRSQQPYRSKELVPLQKCSLKNLATSHSLSPSHG